MAHTVKHPWVAKLVSEVVFPHRSDKGADKKFFSLLLALHDIEPESANELLDSKEMKVISASNNFSNSISSAVEIMADRNKNYYSESFLSAINVHRDVLRSRHWRNLIGHLNGNTVRAWKFFADELEVGLPIKFTNQGSFVRELNELMTKLKHAGDSSRAAMKMESVVISKSLIKAFIPKLGFEYDNLRGQSYLPANRAWDRIMDVQDSNPCSHRLSAILDCSLEVGVDLLSEHYLARILNNFAKQNWLLSSKHGLSENSELEKPHPYDNDWVSLAVHICDSFVVSNPWQVLKNFNVSPAQVLYSSYKKNGRVDPNVLNTHKTLNLYHAHPAIIDSLENFLPMLENQSAVDFAKVLAESFCKPVQQLIAQHAVEIIESGQPPSALYPFFDLQYRLQGIRSLAEFSDPDFRKASQKANIEQCGSLLLDVSLSHGMIAYEAFSKWYTELKLREIALAQPPTNIKRPKV